MLEQAGRMTIVTAFRLRGKTPQTFNPEHGISRSKLCFYLYKKH